MQQQESMLYNEHGGKGQRKYTEKCNSRHRRPMQARHQLRHQERLRLARPCRDPSRHLKHLCAMERRQRGRELQWQIDLIELKRQLQHTDPARPAFVITRPRNGSAVAAGAAVEVEFILLNFMEEEVLLHVKLTCDTVAGYTQEETGGVPHLHQRNVIVITAPPPPSSSWFDVEIVLVRAPPPLRSPHPLC